MGEEYESISFWNEIDPFGENIDGNPIMLVRQELAGGWLQYLKILENHAPDKNI